jgi:hypothetical protein
MEGFVEDKNSPISCHGIAAVRHDWFTRLDYLLPALLRPGCANLASLASGNLGSESDREDVGQSQSLWHYEPRPAKLYGGKGAVSQTTVSNK